MKLPFGRSRKRFDKHGSAHSHHAVSGVVLAPGTSGSIVFLEALAEAVRRFPGALGAVRLPPDGATFKRTFPEVVTRFELHRAAAPERVEIARMLVQALHDRVFFRAGDELVPLAEHLRRPHAAVVARVVGGQGEPRWQAEIPWRQERFQGAAGIGAMIATMRHQHLLTEAAKVALDWVVRRLEANDSRLDLRGERFALLGAGAELAPTELLLAAGADVLWLDRAAPPERLLAGDFPGRLFIVPGTGSTDLLAAPAVARAAIIDFAGADGVHLGLYAYAPGKGRELRLAAAMDAIARSLPANVARSVSLLVSPTTPGEVQPEDREAAHTRRATAQVWKKTLERTGLLSGRAHDTLGATTIARSIVSLQGAAYQAAQYLAKMMAAEAMLADGIGGAPVSISANVAGITATRSLLHPLFQAAFLGAPRFGIEIYEPATTRVLSGLLALHDVLHHEAPGAAARAHEPILGRVMKLAAQTIHGGCRALSWELEPTIRVGALLGLGKQPKLLAGLIPRKKKRG